MQRQAPSGTLNLNLEYHNVAQKAELAICRRSHSSIRRIRRNITAQTNLTQPSHPYKVQPAVLQLHCLSIPGLESAQNPTLIIDSLLSEIACPT